MESFVIVSQNKILRVGVHVYVTLLVIWWMDCFGIHTRTSHFQPTVQLTHWGRVTHLCVSYFTIIGLNNGLLPGRRQAIVWTNAGILLIEHLATNFSEI